MDHLIHIKKFYEDVYHDPSMYYEYLSGKRTIDPMLYSKWYKEMEARRDPFVKFIMGGKKYNNHEFFFETALSKDLAVSRPYFINKSIEVKEFIIPRLEEMPLGDESFHYLCNGCYETTLENIYRVLNHGSFTVGYCGEKKTDEFKEIVKFYNMLKDRLMRKGFIASSMEESVSSKHKLYVLTYQSKNKK
ncbi:MAG: hypothetical protein IJO43_02145 [Bacilli bacterium]|nr:hypothetical protein [Bacilli bacterium]